MRTKKYRYPTSVNIEDYCTCNFTATAVMYEIKHLAKINKYLTQAYIYNFSSRFGRRD